MEEIDYKGVSEQLMRENERLRQYLVARVRFAPRYNLQWFYENYLLIVMVCIVLSCVAQLVEVTYGRRRA